MAIDACRWELMVGESMPATFLRHSSVQHVRILVYITCLCTHPYTHSCTLSRHSSVQLHDKWHDGDAVWTCTDTGMACRHVHRHVGMRHRFEISHRGGFQRMPVCLYMRISHAVGNADGPCTFPRYSSRSSTTRGITTSAVLALPCRRSAEQSQHTRAAPVRPLAGIT